MIRVLVVDDVAFMRIALRRMIDADPAMKVVGEARNGEEAVKLARELAPDAVTMDIEMPVMNGLDAVGEIMRDNPSPPAIIMVSATTQRGASDTIEAFRRGAVDFVSKSSMFTETDLAHIETELRPILHAWAGRHLRPPQTTANVEPVQPRALGKATPDVVLIGASTGGPQALNTLLRAMGPTPVPVIVAQHMPRFFTASLAAMLASDTGLPVQEAMAHVVLEPGSVHLIPGGQHGSVVRGLAGFRLQLAAAVDGIAPSVDRLFETAARAATAPLAVVLTGMGRDGAEGARALAARGATVLAQLPAQCVVAGMPEAAMETGAVTAVLPLADIAAWIAAATGKRPGA